MIIFGIEIRRAPKPVVLTPMQQMEKACDHMNFAWRDLAASGGKVRPWIVHEEKRVVLTKWGTHPIVVYK